MKKVLIVSYHFPTLNSIVAKRYGFMCKYFANYGYEASVLMVRPRSGGYLNTKLELPVPIVSNKVHRIGALGISYPIHSFPINLTLFHIKKGTGPRILEVESIGCFERVKNKIDLKGYKDIDIVIGTFPEYIGWRVY